MKKKIKEATIDLRKLAKGKDCQVRIVGVCNFDPTTTVLAHIRRGGTSGVGMKPPDLCGVWACSSCHDYIDGRRWTNYAEVWADVLDGLCRTLAELSRETTIAKK